MKKEWAVGMLFSDGRLTVIDQILELLPRHRLSELLSC